MEQGSFKERNRQRRERNAFENFLEYAREANLPNPKQAAERAARVLHGDGVDEGYSGNTRTEREEKVPHRLDDRTKEQLYDRAKELDIEGRSQMSKDELIEAIRAQQ